MALRNRKSCMPEMTTTTSQDMNLAYATVAEACTGSYILEFRKSYALPLHQHTIYIDHYYGILYLYQRTNF